MVAWFSSGHVSVASVANHTTRRAATLAQFRKIASPCGRDGSRDRKVVSPRGRDGSWDSLRKVVSPRGRDSSWDRKVRRDQSQLTNPTGLDPPRNASSPMPSSFSDVNKPKLDFTERP